MEQMKYRIPFTASHGEVIILSYVFFCLFFGLIKQMRSCKSWIIFKLLKNEYKTMSGVDVTASPFPPHSQLPSPTSPSQSLMHMLVCLYYDDR